MRLRVLQRFVDFRTSRGVLQLLGVVLLLLVILATGRPAFTNASKPVVSSSSQLAVERAREIAELDATLGDAPSPDREVLRIKQYIAVAIAAVYTAICILAAVALARRSRFAFLIAVAGLTAGAFDTLRAVAILRLIDLPLARTIPAMLDEIRFLSTGKWVSCATVVAILALFLLQGRSARSKVLGVFAIVCGGGIVAGLAQPEILPWTSVAAGIALAVSAVTLKFDVPYEQPSSGNSVPRSL